MLRKVSDRVVELVGPWTGGYVCSGPVVCRANVRGRHRATNTIHEPVL